jgi:hypothetical protein
VHTETSEDDHFANWNHSSLENMRLLYGESPLFSGLRKKKNSTETEPVSVQACSGPDAVRRTCIDCKTAASHAKPGFEHSLVIGADTVAKHTLLSGWSRTSNEVAAVRRVAAVHLFLSCEAVPMSIQRDGLG